MVHNVTVGKADLSTTLQASQKLESNHLNSTKPRSQQESAMNRLFSGRSDMPFALLLLAPSLLLLGGLVAWPMVSNIEISFLLASSPNIELTFVGASNYVRILSDPGFWHSLWMTVWYTALVVAGSTVLGLAVAMFVP